MNWISALHLENVLAEQVEQRRRLSASWGPLFGGRRRASGPQPPVVPGPGTVVRLPSARRPGTGESRRDAA
jgi:hypothetical protein